MLYFWMISIRLPISNFSNPLTKPFEGFPNAPIATDITVSLLFSNVLYFFGKV